MFGHLTAPAGHSLSRIDTTYFNLKRHPGSPPIIAAMLLCTLLSCSASADGGAPATPTRGLADIFTRTLAEAEAAIEAARALGNLWLHTPQYIVHAIERRDAGDYAGAIALAERAYDEAVTAGNQAKLERARLLLKAQDEQIPAATRATVQRLLRSYDGEAALHALQSVVPH